MFLTRLFFAAFLFFTPAAAQAQGIEEYQNVPEGLLLPQEKSAKETTFVEETALPKAMSMEELTEAYKQGRFDLVAKHVIPLAKNEYHPAEELLGILYENGQGVPKNAKEAHHWLSRAAEAARPLAQHHLAIMYFTGSGVEADKVKALTWLYLATIYYPDGIEKKRAEEDLKNLSAQLSRRDRDRAEELARDWLKKRNEAHLMDLR